MSYLKAAVLSTAALLLAGVLAQPESAEVSFDVAYSNLSHHGSWLVSAQYGRVWQPRIYNREWNPYYDGHWVYTDMGWTWVSDYEWGVIPYHYGTWVADRDAGWVWIPGRIWAPSWVVFRTGPDYIGWAPVPPGFSVGMSMEMGGASSFVFVSSRDFLAPRVRTAIIPVARTNVFINQTTIINNFVVQNNVVVNRGPDFKIVERATGRTIREERIESVARVAPFEHVSRAQLAVDPDRVKRGLRVVETVPERSPLPASDKHGRADNQAEGRAPVPAPAQESASKERKAQAPSREAARVTPSNQAERRQPGRKALARANDKTQDAHQPPAPRRDATAGSSRAEKNKANARQRATELPAADAQKARRAQAPPRDTAPASSTEARGKADVKQSAKAQPSTKAKADAEAKKGSRDRKDQNPKGATPEAKEGTHE